MAETALLLTLQPKDAIIRMLNDENGTNFPSGLFDFGQPEVISGRQTRIHLKVRRPVSKLDDVIPPSGELDFTFYRLDVEDHFRDVLSGWRPTLPTSTQVLLDELSRRMGQKFFLEDFVLESISRHNAAPYRLKAKAESLRWVGELEIMLIDLVSLQTYMADAVPPTLGRLSEARQLAEPALNMPFLNATPQLTMLDNLNPGQPAQQSAALLEFMRRVVPAPSARVDQQLRPWMLSTTPGPFNLRNARVIDWDLPPVWPYGYNPLLGTTLNRMLRVELDLALCNNFDGNRIDIPYRVDDFQTSDFNATPRLQQVGVVSMSDGTPWNIFLNNLQVAQVLTSLPVAGDFLINGDVPWVVNSAVPSRTNLYNAVVQYNGQRRVTDMPPRSSNLNRVIVLTMSEHNTGYRGNLTFHYRAPIVLNPTIPNADFGEDYFGAFNPQDNVGATTYSVVDGALAPGHTIDAITHGVRGKATATGSYRAAVRVQDSRGVGVNYIYNYGVVIAALSLTGDAPNGQVGVPYYFRYNRYGGVGPYRFELSLGSVHGGVELDEDTGEIIGTPIAPGTYAYTLMMEDSRGVRTFLQDSFQILP